MANKRIQDLEQTTDLTNDDLIPLDTTKKTFATTLKSLVEWLKNTFQTKDNLEQALSDATDKYPSSKVLKDESSRIVSIMDNQYSNLLSTLYPVGSIYIGTQNSCPLTSLIAGSQWEKVATQVVAGVNNSALVKGNGLAIGITDKNNNYGMMSQNTYYTLGNLVGNKTMYGKTAGTSLAIDGEIPTRIAIGLTQDPAKSGMVATVQSNNLALNIWKRTA